MSGTGGYSYTPLLEQIADDHCVLYSATHGYTGITYFDGGAAVAHFRGELAEVRSKGLAWIDKDLNLAVGEDDC